MSGFVQNNMIGVAGATGATGAIGPFGPSFLTVQLVPPSTAGTTWVQPLLETNLLGGAMVRTMIDYSLGQLSARVLVDPVTASSVVGAKVYAQYSTDGSSWTNVSGTTAGDVNIQAASGMVVGSWMSLPSGAKAGDTFFRVVGSGGNGIAAAVLGSVAINFK